MEAEAGWGWGSDLEERACVEGQCQVFVLQLKLKKFFFNLFRFVGGKDV